MSHLRQKYQMHKQLLPYGTSFLFILMSMWLSFRYIDTVLVCEYCNFKMKSLYNVIILQTIDVPASLLASTLVAMEITVSGLMKLRDYPTELVEKVATCIPIT